MNGDLLTNNWIIFGLVLSIAIIQGGISFIVRLLFRYLDAQKEEKIREAAEEKEEKIREAEGNKESRLIRDLTELFKSSYTELQKNIDDKIEKIHVKFDANDNKYFSSFQNLLDKLHKHLESTRPHALQIYENKAKIQKLEVEQQNIVKEIIVIKNKVEGLKH